MHINYSIIDLSTKEYGHRLCFSSQNVEVNPRNKLGKFGIRNHTGISRFFHGTVKIENDSNIWHVNKKSAVKWLSSISPNDSIARDSETIADKINEVLEHRDRISQPQITNQRSLRSKTNRLKGRLWMGFFNTTKESWLRFKIRFFVISPSEKTLKKASEQAAVAQYHTAKKEVPAYNAFIGKQKPKMFSEIPITSKDNYIKPAISENGPGLTLYKGERIPTGSKNDTSTGTTGVPTQWFRGPKEQKAVEKLSSYAAAAFLGDVPYYFINGFALGQWASGLTAFAATRNDPKATISNPGMDVEKIYNAIVQAAQVVPPGSPIVVAGYPPHLKEVVDLAIAQGFDLAAHNIIGIVGGEAISEGQRELIVRQMDGNEIKRNGFSQCYSTYGASDLDINIGYEYNFEVELRKFCHDRNNPRSAALAAELFGNSGSIPMIFHYDPLNYHIETDENEHLIFTCTRNDRISPRIRYDLGDKGKVMPYSDIIATLKKHNVVLENMPRTQLPFVFVWGRGDSMISYRGANVAPENLGEAIRLAGLGETIEHFAFLQYEDEGKLITEIMIEQKNEGESDWDAVLAQLIDQMKQINPDFKKQYEECLDNDAKPKLRVFEPGTSPMAAQRERYPHAKKKYIFIEKENDEFVSDHSHLGGSVCG